MRTTVTLEPDVAERVHALAHGRRTSFKAMLDTLLRRGIAALDKPLADEPPFVVRAHKGGFRPGVDPLKLNQLVDAIAVDDFAKKTSA